MNHHPDIHITCKSRIRPGLSSVFTHSPVYLVGIWSTCWKFGKSSSGVRQRELRTTLILCPCSQIAWPLIANYSCPQTAKVCPRSQNMGWRYFLFTMGGIMMALWVIRFFVFHLYESPKYLMGRGRDEEAVRVVYKVAAYNGTTSSLTLEQLQNAGKLRGTSIDSGAGLDTSALGAVRRKLSQFSGDHVKSLFATRKLAWSTSLLIVLWGSYFSSSSLEVDLWLSPFTAFIGLAFPLQVVVHVLFVIQILT